MQPIQIVRYGELQPCRTAFIDAHTPGSDQKENFTIIGGGVSESADQHVHIRDTPGFNIGAAGQPPHCRNSLHAHRTAEVFFVQEGRWRFFWGRRGTAGEVILEKGDLIDIPTGIFRGFENVGTDYGMIMAILGGDDAGGGVIWAPQVIEDARDHGLVLSASGRLYDTARGRILPETERPMPMLTDDELRGIPEMPVEAVVPRFIARYQDMLALSARKPADVLGSAGLIRDRPGFEVQLCSRMSSSEEPEEAPSYEVIMVHRGHWRLRHADVDVTLAPGDTCAIAPGTRRVLSPAMSGEAAFFRVKPTADQPGPTKL
jgi:mannose-6-phosphate isomerase-like protein (cupin superfamily)